MEQKVGLIELGKSSTRVFLSVDGSSGSAGLELEWALIAQEIFGVFKRKQKDYGPNNIGLFQDTGIMTRLTDKFMRLHALYSSGDEPKNESIEDTWIDIADYAIIALMCRRGYWPKANLQEVFNDKTEGTAPRE